MATQTLRRVRDGLRRVALLHVGIIILVSLPVSTHARGADSGDNVPTPRKTPSSWQAELAKLRHSMPKREVALKLTKGQSLLGALRTVGVDHQNALAIARALSDEVNLRRLPIGQRLDLTVAADGQPQRLVLHAPTATPTVVTRSRSGQYRAHTEAQAPLVTLATRSFTLGEGLAQRVAAADVPPATLGAALQALGARVDLQRDFNSGDTLYLVYRQRRDTRTGETWNGELLHVSWKPSQGSGLALYRYRDTDGRSAYYDRYGRSLESLLLRTPVDSSNVRLSSLFGKRKHPILGYTRMHRGVDFAAAWGTPVLAAGDGRMTVQRTDPELGNYLRIRHTAGISTGYAHLSVFAADVVAGDRVRQGQVVGYVGMSGLATGPHLHFEVFQDGVRVDPQQFNSTPKRVLEGEERLRFSALKNLLDQQVARHETGRSTATFAYFEAP